MKLCHSRSTDLKLEDLAVSVCFLVRLWKLVNLSFCVVISQEMILA